MKICIHRGANQIGGSCVEVECRGNRIVLDVGIPLNVVSPEAETLPNVSGLTNPDPSLLAVIISHPHQDHYGLVSRIRKDIPVVTGADAQRILERASLFTGKKIKFSNAINLMDDKHISIGPFKITPFLMDHSAFDAYAIMVEADNKRIFYTGDFRAHGRKWRLFQNLVKNPPSYVNLLLMEGTTIRRSEISKGFKSESGIENEMVRTFRKIRGMGLVMCAGQNIDRLVTVFKACIRSDRQLIIDMYTAEILKATKNPKIPQADWEQIRVFLPKNQKEKIKRERASNITEQYRAKRIFPKELKTVSPESVMIFRPSMSNDLEDANCLEGACLIYSMWDGYLKEQRMNPFLDWLSKWKIPIVKCHASGHAPVKDLKKLRDAFPEAVVVPIHTENPELYKELFGKVEIHKDGEWWSV